MSRRRLMTPFALLTLGSLVGLGPSALAQPSSPAPGNASQLLATDADDSETGDRFPVFSVTSVEILRSETKPEISVVAHAARSG